MPIKKVAAIATFSVCGMLFHEKLGFRIFCPEIEFTAINTSVAHI